MQNSDETEDTVIQGFTVPPQFMEDTFVERVKGTGPFTVVLVAVDCEAVKKVTIAPCHDSKVCPHSLLHP